MNRNSSIFIVLLCLLMLLPKIVYGASESLGASAESIRTLLSTAQLTLTDDPTSARSSLGEANNLYLEDLSAPITQFSPEIHTAILADFAQASDALAKGDAVTFARLRSQLWTSLLHVGVLAVDANLVDGNAKEAQQWLAIREFRHATRSSRPTADATITINRLVNGRAGVEEARLAVRSDLFDTYQARMIDALREAIEAEGKSFNVRRAELLGLAQGYFAILTPAYRGQKGEQSAAEMTQRFQSLVAAASQSSALSQQISALITDFSSFRAAPLSANDQVRRAGQLLRFLKLVSVEYNRGVANGAVKSDLELREASTFFEGARAAFDDLYPLLSESNPVEAGQSLQRLTTLGLQVEAALTHSAVAESEVIQAQVQELSQQLQTIMPVEWLEHDSNADFDVIRTALNTMEAAVASGNYELAESARLESYALLESGPEARIQAFAARYKTPIEEAFWYGQGEVKGLAYLIKAQAPLTTIKASRKTLERLLHDAQQAIEGTNSPTAIATNAAIIVFREGLEAVLILASLMGSMKAATSRTLRKPMWWGVIGAVLASILTWLLAQSLLTSLARYGEKLEAVVSLIAIAVLLLITNWFFHQSYWTDHMANLHSRKRGILSAGVSQWLGLAMLGFTSVYREGFETVLFLQALVLEAGTWVVVAGTLVGLAATLAIGLVLFRLQVRMPYKKMLIVTGVFIGVVLLTMVGNTVHIMQVVGWLPLHVIRWLEVPYWLGLWFGIYPSWEGIVLQLVAGLFVIGSYFLAEYLQKQGQKQKVQRNVKMAVVQEV
ncbi:MAG: FTR1 family protein [Caldilineaceae bacterium]